MAHRTSQTLVSTAGELMQKFAKHSGLSSTNSTLPAAETEPTSSRYLWTDSYAVCNFLALGQPEQARALVIKVHQTLARERPPKGSYFASVGLMYNSPQYLSILYLFHRLFANEDEQDCGKNVKPKEGGSAGWIQ